MHLAPRRILVGGLVVLSLAGCDACETRVRNIVYDDVDRTVTPVQLRAQEDELREVEPNDTAAQATPIQVRRDMSPLRAAIDPADDVDWFSLELADDEPWIVELTVRPSSGLNAALYLEVPGDGDYPPLLYDLGGAGEAESVPMLSLRPGEPRRFFVTGVEGTTGDYTVEARRRLSASAVAMEPNDHAHVATTLEVPGEIQGFYDRPHDRDVFRVPGDSLHGAVYGLEVSHIPGIPQRLRIFRDPGLTEALLEMDIAEDRPASIPNLSLPSDAENLYFVMTAGERFNRERPYRIRLVEHPPVSGFVLETEPNDTEASAQLIALGDRVRGYLHSRGDVDRFRFVIEPDDASEEEELAGLQLVPGYDSDGFADDEEEEGEEEFTQDPWAAVPEKEAPDRIVQARLRPLVEAHRFALRWIPDEESREQPIELHADTTSETLILCNHILGPGEYDLEVRSVETEEGHRPRSFDYELSLKNVASLEGLEVEPNDTIEEADRLELDSARTGFISVEGDVDYFAFVIPRLDIEDEQSGQDDSEDEAGDDDAGPTPGGGAAWEEISTQRAKIALEGNRLNLQFELLDDEGGRVALVNRAGPGGNEELTIDLPAGLYYLAIAATSGASCDPYQIRVGLVP